MTIGLFVFFTFSALYSQFSHHKASGGTVLGALNTRKPFEHTAQQYVRWKFFSKESAPLNSGQLFFITLSSTSLNSEEVSFIEKYNPGGIVLLSNNIENPDQLHQLIESINDHSKINPFIALDQEGGSVQRISWDPTNNISAFEIGTLNRNEKEEIFSKRASILKGAGINTNFAPVLDVCSPENIFLTTRCFSNDPNMTAETGIISIQQYRAHRIVSVGKHFPGHGGTIEDSHSTLPIVEKDKQTLLLEDLVPFKAAVDSDIPMIMTSHVLYPNLDDSFPASLSSTILTSLLRQELNFKGIVITDDIAMEALSEFPDPELKAIEAGSDMIVTTHSLDQIQNLIPGIESSFSQTRLNQSSKRILTTKCLYHILEDCK